MNKFKTSAVEILKREKKALHYNEITRLALEAGILETEGATPDASMNSQIIRDIRSKKESSDFIKVGRSTYSHNLNKKEFKKNNKIEEEEEEEVEKIKIGSGYTGKGGEHLVCSELLFKGFNASIMSVDVGMDIIATKENKLISVQVKTANINSFNDYNFDVRKVSFERHDSGSIYYIFVLRGKKDNNFLILPYIEMDKKVTHDAIKYIKKYKKYRVRIMFRNGNIYLGNQNHEMNYYLNNWDIIK